MDTNYSEAISCGSQPDAAGMHWNPQGVTFTNGTSRATYDWIVRGGGSPKEK